MSNPKNYPNKVWMVLVQEVNIGLTQPSVNFLDWIAGPNYIRLIEVAIRQKTK